MSRVNEVGTPSLDPRLFEESDVKRKGADNAPQETRDDKPVVNEFGKDQTRPANDYSTAESIILQEKALSDLGNQKLNMGKDKEPVSIKDGLKKVVGDYENDPDAAYRAKKALEHIQTFDADGKRVAERGDGRIDGFTKSGEAKPKTEAGRLQDFVRDGYGSLKGGAEALSDKPATTDASGAPRPADGDRPLLPLANEGRPDSAPDTAKEIIENHGALRNLGNQSGVKDMLRDRVGDFEKDPDAAWRATQVLDYVQKVDEKGKPTNKPADDKIDGFTSQGHARNGTEAGRLQDFGKGGYASLRGVNGESAEETITNLHQQAVRDLVAEMKGDAKKVGSEYFKDGKTEAGAADKVAAMLDLGKALGNYKNGSEAFRYKYSDSKMEGDGPTYKEERDKFVQDVQSRIDKLSNDSDVQRFMAEEVPTAMRKNVEADPHMRGELERRLQTASSTEALQAAFAQKGEDGKPVGTTEALRSFMQDTGFYASALGKDASFGEAFDKAPQDIKDKIKAGYEGIVSGKDIERLVQGGKPADKAIIESAGDKATYEGLLDDKTVEDGNAKFQEATTRLGRDALLEGATMEDVYKGLGVKDLNDPALKKIIEENLDRVTVPGKAKPKAEEVVMYLRAVDDLVRGGVKFDESMDKVSEAWKQKTPHFLEEINKNGALHAGSGALMAGILGAKAAAGQNGDTVTTTAQAFQSAGLLVEGGTKAVAERWEKFNEGRGGETQAKVPSWLKDVENVGKAVGGVVGNALGLVAGTLSARGAADKGDTFNAGFQGTLAGLNGLASVTTAAEVAAYAAPRIMSLGTVAASPSVASFGAAAGAATGIIGGALAVGTIAYLVASEIKADIQQTNARNNWYDGAEKSFAELGIQMPDRDATFGQPNDGDNKTEKGALSGS